MQKFADPSPSLPKDSEVYCQRESSIFGIDRQVCFSCSLRTQSYCYLAICNCDFHLILMVVFITFQINLNESYEMKEELEKENAHFKKMVTSLKQKLDKSKEANVMLKV